MLSNQSGPHFPGHTINCHLQSHRVIDYRVWRTSVLVSKVISLWAVSPYLSKLARPGLDAWKAPREGPQTGTGG